MAFEIGEAVGDYQIVGVLGAGGMGKVYKVKNTISERVEAMKVLLPSLSEDHELADRFTREIKVLASLNHPNIAGLRTAFRQNDQLLMVMEFVEGKTLDDMVKSGPISVPDAINYVTQVLGALGYAHKHGVVHRDIKPANMMLTTEGVIKLMDFGIAKTKNDRKLTQTGGTLGSLFYMSTEQVQGEDLDGRSDLYSVGVSLYEMVTGTRPFKGKSEFDIMIAQLQQAPMPPIQMMPNLPKALNDIIVLSLEKDKNKRFQTAEAFSAALASISGQALNATPMHSGTELLPTVMAPGPETGSATAAFGAATQPTPQPTAYMNAATASQTAIPTVQTAPPVPASDPSHGVPVPAPSGSKGYRGLYMTLGALIALAVIVLAATQLPRVFKTHASSDQTAQSTSQPAPNSGQPSNPGTPASGATSSSPSSTPDAGANGSASPTAGGATAASTTEGTSAGNAASNGSASVGTSGTPPASSGGSAAASSGPQPGSGTPGSAGHTAKASGHSPMNGASSPYTTAAGAQAAQNSVPGAAGQTSQPAAQAGPGNAQEMAELTDLHDKLSVRATQANSDVEALRRQMAATGSNLRSDISASQTRMKMYMDKFDVAMNSGDTVNARKYMSLAEREVDNLEKFLGH